MRISKFVPAVLVAACITSLVAAQQARTPVTIVVTDPSGAAVPYAQVQVIPAPAPVPAPMATDEKGKLRLDLLPGKYALYVGGRTFIPTGADINVQPSNSGQTVTVTLQKAVGPIIDAYAPELGLCCSFLLLIPSPSG
jgi:hypothetical protein